VDARTEELREAHDVLAEVYAERLPGALDRMPIERAVLGLFAELVHATGTGTEVGDIGCGTGWRWATTCTLIYAARAWRRRRRSR